MPKLKTHKGVKGRFRVTGRGKLVHSKGGRRHLLTGRTPKRKRGLRRPKVISETLQKKIRALIPWS